MPMKHGHIENRYIPELIAAQAAASPDALAVKHGKRSLTYKELDLRSGLLARRLRFLGVGPNVVVALYLNRCPAMIVAALAVLKAGGAYLPIDPSYPKERLSFLLQDGQTCILLTGNCIEAMCVEAQHIITLDPDGDFSAPGELEPFFADVDPSDLAYVIYTSGSTGQPKGVEVTHGGLLNLISWHLHAFNITPRHRASHIAPVSFDAAVWEVWPYLCAGASLHIPDGVAVNEPEVLRDWLVSQEITIGFIATPLAERLITLEWPANAALRVMLTGADTLHHYPPRRLRFQLVNNYGPTECTVVASSGAVSPNEHPDRLPTIGRPIDGVQIYILDEYMQEVPPGEPGEIYIGGEGVARGYRNRPDLTSERFVPNLFSSEPSTRLYKTGDLARYLRNGEIAFLGRVDDQIKVRGFRIEPAEIVKVLDEHPAVQASAVVARDGATGEKKLVGYVVTAPNAQPTHSELRNFIAARLPEYMVPATFVTLQDLPLSPSGKIDRTRLPEPGPDNILRDHVFVAPRTPIEERVASILASLLGLPQVSVEDNFFLLGGHSLLGTQLIARVRDEFQIELSLRSLFEAPTVQKLSERIEDLLVAMVEEMSEEEAQRLLNATSAAEGSAS
jgi:amino acid adenylation domain-containing protein